jgi:hypothetical protein
LKNESFVTVNCGRGLSKLSICLVIGVPSLKFDHDHNMVMVKHSTIEYGLGNDLLLTKLGDRLGKPLIGDSTTSLCNYSGF